MRLGLNPLKDVGRDPNWHRRQRMIAYLGGLSVARPKAVPTTESVELLNDCGVGERGKNTVPDPLIVIDTEVVGE